MADRLPERDDETMIMGTPAAGDTQTIPTINAPVADDALGGLLPMLDDPRRRFDTVMRGYDRHQVDVYVAKLEDDNRSLATGRSENSTRVSDLAAQLASAQAEIESLRRRVAAAVETIDPDNVDSRVQEVVALAQQVARQTRADAENDARRIRESATASAETAKAEAKAESDQVMSAATQRMAEADQTYTRKVSEADAHAAEVGARAEEELRLAREEVAALRGTATQEVAQLRATAAEEIAEAATASSAARTEADRVSREARERADAEAAAKRRQAEEDFEITLRVRRRREEEEDRERRAAALREATGIVSDAGDTADRITREAKAEVERLDHERHRVHAELGTIAGRIQGIVSDHDPARNPLATS
ncbi:DivIVA domain-containing protein [Jatrophihabitans sp. YIM 134969]